MNAPHRPSEADIWERIIHPDGPISKETARRILEMEFSSEDCDRMHELAARNRRGELNEEDGLLLDHFCRVGSLLSTLKSRARQVLKVRPRRS